MKRVETAIDRNEIFFIPSLGILRSCGWGNWTWRLGFAFLKFRISIGFGRRYSRYIGDEKGERR